MNRTSLLSIVATGVITAGLAFPAMAKTNGDTHTGTAKVKLQYVYGLQQNGSPDPAHNAACKTQLARFLGMPVTTQYEINTKSLMMSAKSIFPSPVKTQPLELSVDLNALGLAGNYSFGTFRPSVLPEAYAVLFSISKKFTAPKSSFIFFGPKDQQYNCLISSAKNATKSPESAKFGLDAPTK